MPTTKKSYSFFKFSGPLLMTLLAASFIYDGQLQRKINQSSVLTSGIGTCFERAAQSTMALMMRQFGSAYLASSFHQNTNDCFQEVSKQAQRLFGEQRAQLLSVANELQGDAYWYGKRIEKGQRVVSYDNIAPEESNIVGKFAALENKKDNLASLVQEYRKEQSKRRQYNAVAAASFAFFFLLQLIISWLGQRKRRALIRDLNAKAASFALNAELIDSASVDRLLERFCSYQSGDSIYHLFSLYNEQLLERLHPAVNEGVVRGQTGLVSTEHQAPKDGDQASFLLDDSFTTILTAIEKKAFTHGVLIDFEVDDHLRVYGQAENFEQLLFNVLNFGIDSSLAHNEGRKITVRSKVLAENILIKIKVANHFFTVDQLEALNDEANSGGDIDNLSLGLVIALIEESKVQVEARNVVDKKGNLAGLEFEFVLEGQVQSQVSSEDKSSKLISLMRGSKKDLLAHFQNEK